MEFTKPGMDIKRYKQHFLNVAKETTSGRFLIDSRNCELVSSLFNYFMHIPGNLDLQKGLWLEGNVGTGKSTLMQVFSAYMRSLQQGFKVFSCTGIATCYSVDGKLDFFLHNKDGFLRQPVPICFDELGKEPIPASYYGTKLNVMQHILHVRYEFWKTTGLKTYLTTNEDAEGIEKRYGNFIRDRRKEMFNIIPVQGLSRR